MLLPVFCHTINQSISHAAGDAPYISLKKRIVGGDRPTPFVTRSQMKVCRNTIWGCI